MVPPPPKTVRENWPSAINHTLSTLRRSISSSLKGTTLGKAGGGASKRIQLEEDSGDTSDSTSENVASRTNEMVVKTALLLPRLDGVGSEGSPVAHLLDMQQCRKFALASKKEIAVVAMHDKVVRHCLLRRRQADGDDGAAIHTARMS